MGNLSLMYFIEEQRLEIYSKEELLLTIDRVRLSKNKLKKLIRQENCYVYLDVVFKSPLKAKDIDSIDLGY